MNYIIEHRHLVIYNFIIIITSTKVGKLHSLANKQGTGNFEAFSEIFADYPTIFSLSNTE